MIQLGGFLGRRLGPLLKTRLTLTKNLIKTLAKSDLIPLELATTVMTADVEYMKNVRIW